MFALPLIEKGNYSWQLLQQSPLDNVLLPGHLQRITGFVAWMWLGYNIYLPALYPYSVIQHITKACLVFCTGLIGTIVISSCFFRVLFSLSS